MFTATDQDHQKRLKKKSAKLSEVSEVCLSNNKFLNNTKFSKRLLMYNRNNLSFNFAQ